MTPEQWQHVKQVLAAALERPVAERQAYLDQVCTEPMLRRELESLIAAHDQSDRGFTQRPASTATNEILQPGTQIGWYEIVAPLGAGGMGVVYKARDLKLGRFLALKLPPEGALANETSRARLLREAQHASALNHPNIATIYDAGEDTGRVYIAMELVEGQPLRMLVKAKGLPTETVIRYGLQISSALAHAHERGVIHRDLKTANVVITSDGRAKVLDFGLAKRFSSEELAEVTRSQATLTEAGNIVGTPAYMAPETLRGESADARTDIWALGAVLYEMASGTQTFQGHTPYELIQAILWESPNPLPPRVPQGVRAIIQRCLSKEPGQRYQRAAEVRAALEAVEPHASPTPAIPSPLPRAKPAWLRIATASGFLAVVGFLLAAAYAVFRPGTPAPASVSPVDWVQLTDFADSVTSPALSADGKMLTFIHGASTFFGQGEINAKVLPNGDPVELTHDGTMKMSPQFSPDGSTIAYTVFLTGNWDTWIVPVLGGESRKTLTNVEGLTWIDADLLLFSEIISGAHMAVVTSGQSNDARRFVYVPPHERGMAHRSAISPDHQSLLLAEMDNGGWLPCRLVPFDGSSAGRIVGPADAACTYVAWSPDGKWMYLNSESGGRFHVWRQLYPDGKPEQLTSGATEEEGIAVAPDGGSFITSVGLRENTIWIQDSKGEHRLSSQGFATNPQFSRDGKKLYYLVRRHGLSGQFVNGELWVVDLANNHSERALPGFEVSGFYISTDEKKVVFSATEKDNVPSLWLASLDLKFPPRRFPSTVSEDQPYFDDAGNIYFRASEGNQNFIYRMRIDGSDRQKAFPNPILELQSVSPDGKSATVWAATQGTEAHNFAVPLFSRGTPITICTGYCGAKWSVDGKILALDLSSMEGMVTMLANVPLGGLPPLPAAGVQTLADIKRVKGAKVLNGYLTPSPLPGLVAAERQEVHRNLYRVPIQ